MSIPTIKFIIKCPALKYTNTYSLCMLADTHRYV